MRDPLPPLATRPDGRPAPGRARPGRARRGRWSPARTATALGIVAAVLASSLVAGAVGLGPPSRTAAAQAPPSTVTPPAGPADPAAPAPVPGPVDPAAPTTSTTPPAPDTLPADLAAVAAAVPAQILSSGDDDAVVPAAGVSAPLAGALVSGPTVAEAERSRRAVVDEIEASRAAQAAAAAEVERLTREAWEIDVDRTGLDAELAAHRQREQAARARSAELTRRADQVRDLLQELAASAYVGVGTDPVQLESPKVTDGTRRTSYRRNLFELKRGEWLEHLAQRSGADTEADAAAGDAARVEAALAQLEAARTATRVAAGEAEQRRLAEADTEARLGVRLASADTVLAEARRTATVVGLDLPLVVLDAIWSATTRMAAERPACHLRWNLLAAISRIESGHGRFGTSSVDRNGSVQPRIVGPPLDGQLFALIGDSDGGRLDGDTTYDRAVGPMQFIPTSWAIFGRDGNGDGLGDPNNYYDAALAAADHLCQAGADTATEAGLAAAVLSYNPSGDYLRSVVGQALAYARFDPPS